MRADSRDSTQRGPSRHSTILGSSQSAPSRSESVVRLPNRRATSLLDQTPYRAASAAFQRTSSGWYSVLERSNLSAVGSIPPPAARYFEADCTVWNPSSIAWCRSQLFHRRLTPDEVLAPRT